MPRFTLKYSEMAWWLIDNEGVPLMNKKMIGNYRDVALLRDGHDVLITSDTIGYPKSRIIPADTVVKGFCEGRDGQTLYQLTDIGYIYNHALRMVAS